VKISLFTQSLFALPLDEVIPATVACGYPAMELACTGPHLDLDTARRRGSDLAAAARDAGLEVSALSLFNSLTEAGRLEAQLTEAEEFIALAPVFGAAVVKLTPGAPASAEATQAHWDCLARALPRLIAAAEGAGVRLAFETHMRQLTDTLAGSLRLLELAASDTVGLTVDFSNLVFAGEDLAEAIPLLAGRMYNAHVKNGRIGADGSWQFLALDTGLTEYADVLPLAAAAGYEGYLAVECLGADAKTDPVGTARRDREILTRYLERI